MTIPADFVQALGIEDDALLQVTLTDGELRIKPLDASSADRDSAPTGSAWLREAYDAFAPIRQELAEKYGEDEIDAAIDQALRAVRQADAPRGV